VRFAGNKSDGMFRIDAADSFHGGIGSHPPADDEIMEWFHGLVNCYLLMVIGYIDLQ
jgi:hypothetical protein